MDERVITVPLLQYYDEKLKAYIKTEISGNVIFGELPSTGEKGILYVVDNSIKVWNGEEFSDIMSKGESNIQEFIWETF